MWLNAKREAFRAASDELATFSRNGNPPPFGWWLLSPAEAFPERFTPSRCLAKDSPFRVHNQDMQKFASIAAGLSGFGGVPAQPVRYVTGRYPPLFTFCRKNLLRIIAVNCEAPLFTRQIDGFRAEAVKFSALSDPFFFAPFPVKKSLKPRHAVQSGPFIAIFLPKTSQLRSHAAEPVSNKCFLPPPCYPSLPEENGGLLMRKRCFLSFLSVLFLFLQGAAAQTQPAAPAQVVPLDLKTMSAPEIRYSVDPIFNHGLQGVYKCVISLIVDTEGNPHDIQVVQSAGTELDASAIEAVRQFKFKPARMKDSKTPVAVRTHADVNFNLH